MKNTNKTKIVQGRLYGWRGNIVRAGKPTNNGLRHIKVHNQLHGWVKDEELHIVGKTLVDHYLTLAGI